MPIDVTMSIPQPEAAPKEGALPSHFPKRNNLAGDEKLVQDVQKHLESALQCYLAQDARKKFVDSGGVMDNADRAWRVALRRDSTSAQYQDSLSDVASSVFHRAIRALTAGENAVFFQGDELPARYEKDLNTDDYSPADGEAQAKLRNLVRDYTWEQDERRDKVKKANMFKNKYGQQLWSIEWDYKKVKRMVKIRDAQGNTKRVEREVVVKECPTLQAHDMARFYSDAYIPELQNQRTTLQFNERGYEYYADLQRGGIIMNLDKVTAAMAHTGEVNENLRDRRESAGETPEVRENAMIGEWFCWARLPIKESKSGKKGKIDRRQEPQWYRIRFAGGSWNTLSGSVCVEIVKNPYAHGELPYFMDYAYHDDKGLYHVAPWNLVESAYWQVVTNLNQAIDNVTLRNRAPYTVDGPVHTRDMTFRANKVIRLGKGTTLEPIVVNRTTEITMEMKRELEDEILKAIGITQTIEGTPLGGRTSASEASNDLDQAMKPLMQKADENGQPFYHWMMRMDAELWDQFAREDLTLRIAHMDNPMQIDQIVQPALIFGPFKVKVTAVTEFENRATRRRELNGFFQAGLYDRAAEVMPIEAKTLLFRQVGNEFGFRRVSELFPPTGDRDSQRRAAQESVDMLFKGAFVPAEQGENHAAHLRQHESYLHEYSFLPERDQEAEGRLQQHIEQHKAFQAEVSQGQAPGLQEGTEGELNANPLEAAAGAQANLG